MKTKVLIPLADAWRVLNPCPTVLVTSREKRRNHVAAVAWCMPLDFDPPRAVLVLAEGHATADTALRTGELVINVPPAEMAGTVLACGSSSGRAVDKFKAYGLTPLRSRKVKPPGIAECLASLECKVLDRITTFGRHLRGKYDLVAVEIVSARVDKGSFDRRWLLENGVRLLHHLGSDGFEVSGRLLRAKKTKPR